MTHVSHVTMIIDKRLTAVKLPITQTRHIPKLA